MKSRKRQTINIKKKNKFSFKFYIYSIILTIILGYPVYFLVKSAIANYQLETNSKIIKAVVIDEENYVGHSPVEHRFFYSYEFILDGKAYKGNTRNTRYQIGDSVNVRYSVSNPSFNEIVKDDD